jgi:phi13 family phage major tail protein
MTNPNSSEYKSRVGLDSLYIAEVTQDDTTAYVAATPEYFAPAAEASAEASVNRKTQYADDRAYDAMSAEGETTIKLTVTNIPIEVLSLITGKVFDAATGRMFDNGGTPPYFALMFRSKKSNGSYRYYSFLKGRFDTPSESYASITDSVEPKPLEITYTAIKSEHEFDLGSIDDGVKRLVGDEDTTNFDATGWFTQVQTPDAGSISALALSTSDPADGATAVAVSKTIALTFSNALPTTAIANVVVVEDDGTVIACTNSLDATKKIMTVNPDSNMSAATVIIVAIGVKDIYGQVLNTAVNFTTA